MQRRDVVVSIEAPILRPSTTYIQGSVIVGMLKPPRFTGIVQSRVTEVIQIWNSLGRRCNECASNGAQGKETLF